MSTYCAAFIEWLMTAPRRVPRSRSPRLQPVPVKRNRKPGRRRTTRR